MTEKRLIVLVCTFISFAFLVQLNMVRLACSGYREIFEKYTVKHIDISAGRADIADCNLNKITGTQTRIKALITRETDLQDIFENIRPRDREKFYSRIQQESRMVVNLENSIDSDTIYTTSKRYSSRNLAQHLIGYLDMEENGIAGLERVFDSRLKDSGEKVTLSFKVNGRGEIYGDVETHVTENASLLALTIDNSFQRMAESVAREYITNGSIVIMESKTGKILAMASTPVYDANNVADYLKMENSPMVNKALQCYEPGSVIKPLWAAAMLESGADKDRIYQCVGYTEVNGHTYHCANDRAHGPVDMEKALVMSCNCYFIDKYINNKGFVFKQTANRLNFGNPIQLCDGYYTNRGTFPTVQQTENKGVLSSVSFGQGNFLVSPVHVAAGMNVFANDGVYVAPQIVQGIYDEATGEMLEKIFRLKRERVFSRQTARAIKDMLVQVADEGNGGRARPQFLGAGGKTGTAQTGKIKDDGEEIFTAWFCGFYPADNPHYTICISMYDGGESSYSAAPVFKTVCDNIYYMKFAR